MSEKQEAILDNFEKLEIEKPSDKIIARIKDLISSGVLKPGDRLPAERSFAERFGVGRGHVRDALKKLEFYGIVKTMPQSGTYVSNMGAKALEGLISNILDLEREDRRSLLETRHILEVNAARLAAMRADNTDIIDLIRIHEEFRRQLRNRVWETGQDRRFHLKIAECSKNTFLTSLITLLLTNSAPGSDGGQTVHEGKETLILKHHEAILQAIKQKTPDQAAEAMKAHLDKIGT